jgi:uncharacterized OB-fold protein
MVNSIGGGSYEEAVRKAEVLRFYCNYCGNAISGMNEPCNKCGKKQKM